MESDTHTNTPTDTQTPTDTHTHTHTQRERKGLLLLRGWVKALYLRPSVLAGTRYLATDFAHVFLWFFSESTPAVFLCDCCLVQTALMLLVERNEKRKEQIVGNATTTTSDQTSDERQNSIQNTQNSWKRVDTRKSFCSSSAAAEQSNIANKTTATVQWLWHEKAGNMMFHSNEC